MIPQRSKEWFEARKKRITGSIVGAILGEAPYMTRDDAMRLMVREALGAEREFKGNVATEYGAKKEELACLDFELETGLCVDEAPFVPFEDWLGASPDGFIDDDALLEIKCPYGLRKAEAPVPFKTVQEQPHYYSQMQAQMLCTGRDKCYFWQWTPLDYKLDIVHKDQDWLNQNLPILRQFYAEFLDELKAPELHLEPLRKEIDTPQAHRMVEEWDSINEQMALLQERKTDLLNDMKALANGKNILLAGRKFTKVEKQGTISYSSIVKKLLPEVDLEEYRSKSSCFWKIT